MRCDCGADVSMCRLRTPFSVAPYVYTNIYYCINIQYYLPRQVLRLKEHI